MKGQSRQYGLPETIEALKRIGQRWHARHPSGPPIRISDISRRGGGSLPFHASHRIGIDVDIRFIRKDGKLAAVNPLISSQRANFDRARTQDLVKIIRANGVLSVHRLWINKRIGLDGINGDNSHNDHMHVRFCVPARLDLSAIRRAAKLSSKGTYSSC
jgi:murein endopeptidase